jgi:hypothetical protein
MTIIVVKLTRREVLRAAPKIAVAHLQLVAVVRPAVTATASPALTCAAVIGPNGPSFRNL